MTLTLAPLQATEHWPRSRSTAAELLSIQDTCDLGAVRLTRVGAAGPWRAQHAACTGKEEMLLMTVQRSGVGRLLQGGRTTIIAPGDLVVFSTARPYALEFAAGFEQLVLWLPPTPLRSLCPGIDAVTGVAVRSQHAHGTALTALAASCFETARTGLPVEVGQHLVLALQHALAACAGAVLAQGVGQRRNLSRFHLDRIRQHVLAHIGDNDLSVADVVAALGISAAHLHRLFAAGGRSFGTWLWETRLQMCHLALRDPAFARVSISRIAFHFGYSHAAHFSRAYRNCYGMTPSAWRRGAA